MYAVDELIKLKYIPSIDGDNIVFEYAGLEPPNDPYVDQLFKHIKRNKPLALDYCKRLLIYEAPKGVDLDIFTENCIQKALDNGIVEWLRVDCHVKSRRIVLVGILNSVESKQKWEEMLPELEEEGRRDCPWPLK